MHAAEQSIVIEHRNSADSVESPPGEAFLEQFKVAFDRRVDAMFADRFHPFNTMNWSVELADGNSGHLRERSANSARNALSKSVVYGVREAAVDLPFMLWLKERQGLLADFLRNSVDSTEEEEVAPLDVSYRSIERSWWQRLSDNGHVSYGIRPFRTSPYTFLSLALKDDDHLFLLGHVRYHYRNLSDHRFEVALSVPLTRGLAIDVGTSYEPGRDREAARPVVIKFFKEFKRGGIMHVGLEARERPTFFAGIALPW